MQTEESLEERLKAGYEESKIEKNIEVRKKRAQEWYEIGLKREDPEQKAACLELAVDFGLSNADIFSELGLVHYKSGHWDKAVEYFKKTIKENPKHVLAHARLGLSYSHKGKYRKAVGFCKKAIKLDPRSSTAHEHLGYVYYQHRFFGNAIKSFQDALDVNPNNAWVYYHLGNTYMLMKEFDKAIECHKKAVEINPKFEIARNAFNHLQELKKKGSLKTEDI